MYDFSFLTGLIVFTSYLPSCFYCLLTRHNRMIFRFLVAAPLVVSCAYLMQRQGGLWRGDFATSLWVCLISAHALFFVLSVKFQMVEKLALLGMPYFAILALFGALWTLAPVANTQHIITGQSRWLVFHIFSSVLTYGLLTLAALAALALYIRERALKNKNATIYSDQLPAMLEAEKLQIRLMILSEIILGMGLISGIATQRMLGQDWFQLDHKIFFSLFAFLILGILILVYYTAGIRGQKGARLLLVCYLFLTMSFPGVKFVNEIIRGF